MPRRRLAAVNTAPPAGGTSPLVASGEVLRFQRQSRHNPLPYLKPDMLSRALDQFDHGYLREAVLLWEKIAERDDTISSVKPKREKDVSQLAMEVVASPNSGAEGEAQKEVLYDFWRNVRCVNAFDRNERGGFRRLVKQMMTAVSYRYAAHHIVWQPRPDGTLRATFEFVPLWQFENRSGTLRYLRGMAAVEGEVLADGEWMVTTGDGLMISCSIGYLAKRSAFNDWLIFSEKFSVPGVLGRTSARKGSPEAEAMRAAVESFGHDWTACIYGDDGLHGEPIKLIQASGSPQAMPMPAVVERVDRKFAALYRGADLSTMSSSSGEGTGASLQERETDILRRDDAETIAETLEEVSRMVIEWHFGHGVEPLARVGLVVPVAEDVSAVISNAISLAAAGADISKSALMERAGIHASVEPEDRLGTAAAPPYQAVVALEDLQNAATAQDADDETPGWIEALRADLSPLGRALYDAMAAGDDAAVSSALRKLSERMPEFLETAALEEYLQNRLVAALGDGTEDGKTQDQSAARKEAANSGNPNGSRKGWETRRRNGWYPKNRPKGTGKPLKRRQVDTVELVLDAAFVDVDSRDFATYQKMDPTAAERIMDKTRETAGSKPHRKQAPDLTGWERIVEADKVNKVLPKHGTDRLPVEEEDFRRLPEMLANPDRQYWEEVPGLSPVLRSEIDEGHKTIVIEEAYTGKHQLTILSIYRP